MGSRRFAGVAGLSGLIGFGFGRGLDPYDQSKAMLEEILSVLQGEWEDEIGITIRISGMQAQFTDDPSGIYRVQEKGGDIILRGARLVSLGVAPDVTPVWMFPWGLQHQWERLTTKGFGDDQWDEVFRQYKGDRLDLWEALCSATEDGCLRGDRLQESWRDGSPLPDGLFARFWRSRLLAGQDIVPGVCFVHRKFGYRGVVIGHDSKCIARESWKAQMVVDQIPGGENQPFYHCIVDERDRPGGQLTYVAEVNVVPQFSERAFPLQADLATALLVRCDAAFGYTLGPRLRKLIRDQRATGGRFIL